LPASVAAVESVRTRRSLAKRSLSDHTRASGCECGPGAGCWAPSPGGARATRGEQDDRMKRRRDGDFIWRKR
jgi:hypothetical protein